ncbi:MAG: hypothetical protein ACKN81_10030, partial [Pirellulaceae bacterium]
DFSLRAFAWPTVSVAREAAKNTKNDLISLFAPSCLRVAYRFRRARSREEHSRSARFRSTRLLPPPPPAMAGFVALVSRWIESSMG